MGRGAVTELYTMWNEVQGTIAGLRDPSETRKMVQLAWPGPLVAFDYRQPEPGSAQIVTPLSTDALRLGHLE